MSIFDRFIERALDKVIESRSVIFGPENMQTALLPPSVTDPIEVHVTVEKALHLTAVWSAVNFLSRSLASLPIEIYRNSKDGRTEVPDSPIWRLLNRQPNPYMSAYDWRKAMWDSVFLHGRAFTYVERSISNKVINLYPLDYNCVNVQVVDGELAYYFDNSPGEIYGNLKSDYVIRYSSDEILDIRFMQKSDLVNHYSPILTNSYVMAVGIASAKYAAKNFARGGTPPLAMVGPFSSGAAVSKASDEVSKAVLKTAREGKNILPLPLEYKIERIGFTPAELQSIETERWIVEQVSRIYSLPPTLLQDLSNTSFNTSEDMDLQFTRHTLRPWAVQLDQALDMKLLSTRGTRKQFIEHSIDGLLRGDFKSRMEGSAKGIQTGQLTPNEARKRDNRPPLEGGDDLMIQSGTVPIKKLDEFLSKGNKITPNEDNGSDSDADMNDGDQDGGDTDSE